MFDFSSAIQSVGEAFTSLFNYCTKTKEVQSETQIVKDKNRLKKATNIAQEIFRITDIYKSCFMAKDLKEYGRLRRQFDEKD